eukprot:6178637-Pleurochrysis_carterae.AAC.1
MNDALAEAFAGALRADAPREGHDLGARGVAHAAEAERGGRLTQGATLAGEARAAVSAARRTPAPFASARNYEPEDEGQLAVEPLPGDLRAPQPAAREGKRGRARARKALPRGGAAPHGAPRMASQGRERPAGAVAIHELFLRGVYDGRVQSWFQAADAAVAALRQRAAGEEVDVPPVPTV